MREDGGYARKRLPLTESPLALIRYYDVNRDYQPGLQRIPGRPQPGQPSGLDLPAALTSGAAHALIERAARRAGWGRQSISWRSAAIDPLVKPGALVRIPEQPGIWRVNEWEWRANGVELALWRVPIASGSVPSIATDAGRAAPPVDALNGPTVLAAFELPWDGLGTGDTAAVFPAASSTAAGWTGAALFVDQGDGQLQPAGNFPRIRCTFGHCITVLGGGSPLLFDRINTVTVALLSSDMALVDATSKQLAAGTNRALVGNELLQFARAVPLGDLHWRLEGLLRGRGGTEQAIEGHATGEPFVLLDGQFTSLDAVLVGDNSDAAVVAIGLGDDDPAASPILCRGLTRRPLSPVHPRSKFNADGSLTLGWTRRARGAWAWLNGVETPLHEQAESYDVTVGSPAAPVARWVTAVPSLTIDAAQLAVLSSAAAGAVVMVRQRGSYAVSTPLLLDHLP